MKQLKKSLAGLLSLLLLLTCVPLQASAANDVTLMLNSDGTVNVTVSDLTAGSLETSVDAVLSLNGDCVNSFV